MKRFFSGNKYNFEITYKQLNKHECSWTLKAICKATNRCSGVNNLNPVLSELGINEGIVCGKFEDSFGWKVSIQEMKKFNQIAKSFLTSENYLKYLENKLDEDRGQGEWENVRH
ncbi:hypothetical protein HYY71_01030 [Candidatus Woesearchaeota archaeon]|nr:hypothetical protein [Candidatus Woesearchaeota archaeon]